MPLAPLAPPRFDALLLARAAENVNEDHDEKDRDEAQEDVRQDLSIGDHGSFRHSL
jgi:hypothetical protein